MANTAFLHASKSLYQLVRPLLFTQSAQDAHARVSNVLKRLDNNETAILTLRNIHKMSFQKMVISAGDVWLDNPFILAAGFVKGMGFEDEKSALNAIRQGINIMPGWRAMPSLVGAVEFGSFTRHPRIGNSGTVMWRDQTTYSTQNRVGLKNPGAVAAAAFLYIKLNQLPKIFGINIAMSPGVDDPDREKQDVIEAVNAFLMRGIYPSWFTLNISCPNTEDDPEGNQTESGARTLCEAVVNLLKTAQEEIGNHIPLWVKVSPSLSSAQYEGLMHAFHETGVKAVIATNTLPASTPDKNAHIAGVGGGRLHSEAVKATQLLVGYAKKHDYALDVVGCGGVQDPQTYHDFVHAGADVVQYWSSMIYRGPLVAALILNDLK